MGEDEDAPANDDQSGFTGHVEDAATGLTYMQARCYDPKIGRFISTDPVQFSAARPDMFGRYTYATNDPVNLYDPDGEQAVAVGGRLALAGGAAAIDGPLPIGDIVAGGILIYTGAQLVMNNNNSDDGSLTTPDGNKIRNHGKKGTGEKDLNDKGHTRVGR
ncbi:MAG: RHS repeat-associated core domain-containing protein [Pseudomonadota bacterium]